MLSFIGLITLIILSLIYILVVMALLLLGLVGSGEPRFGIKYILFTWLWPVSFPMLWLLKRKK